MPFLLQSNEIGWRSGALIKLDVTCQRRFADYTGQREGPSQPTNIVVDGPRAHQHDGGYRQKSRWYCEEEQSNDNIQHVARPRKKHDTLV